MLLTRGEGLQEVGLAHDVGIDEGLGTAGFFVGVERIRSQDAVDDVVIHAFYPGRCSSGAA